MCEHVRAELLVIGKAPDAEKTVHSWISGELLTYLHDWKIEFCTEDIIDCMSSGVPHQHAVNRIVARKETIRGALSTYGRWPSDGGSGQ